MDIDTSATDIHPTQLLVLTKVETLDRVAWVIYSNIVCTCGHFFFFFSVQVKFSVQIISSDFE